MDSFQAKEVWDAYDCKGKRLNHTLIRGEIIPDGMYHLVAEIVVRHKDGSFLAMQRDFCKKNYGGFWEISAGGAVQKGETALLGAVRELFEETGIVCNEFSPIYSICYDDSQSIHCGFVCTVDCDKDKIVLQKGETVDYCWVNTEDIFDFVMKDDYVDCQRARIMPYIYSVADGDKRKINSIIGSVVSVKIDRPLGSVHPKHSDIIYPINYGFAENIFADDGEEQDVYVFGVDKPIEKMIGRVVAVIKRNDDVENKWVVVPCKNINSSVQFGTNVNLNFSKEEIYSTVYFQEQYFDSEIIM